MALFGLPVGPRGARGMGAPRMTEFGRPMFTPGRTVRRGPVLAGMSRPVAVGPQAPRVPQAPQAPQSPQAPGSPDVRDPQYFNDVAGVQNYYSSHAADLNAQDQSAQVALKTALANLARQQPLDLLKAQQGANRSGLFYSGQLGKQEGLINENYAQRQDAENQRYSGLHNAILRQLSDLGATYGPDGTMMTDALLKAGGRAINQDAANGVADAPVQAPSVPPAAPPAPAARVSRVSRRAPRMTEFGRPMFIGRR